MDGSQYISKSEPDMFIVNQQIEKGMKSSQLETIGYPNTHLHSKWSCKKLVELLNSKENISLMTQ